MLVRYAVFDVKFLVSTNFLMMIWQQFFETMRSMSVLVKEAKSWFDIE